MTSSIIDALTTMDDDDDDDNDDDDDDDDDIVDADGGSFNRQDSSFFRFGLVLGLH